MKQSYTAAELAQLLGAELQGNADTRISGIATLENAGPEQLAFLHSSRYQGQLKHCRAGVVLVRSEFALDVSSVALIVDDPYLAYALASKLFDHSVRSPTTSVSGGVSSTAVVDSSARIANSAVIGANAVIGSGTVIAEGVQIGANTVIGNDCVVGENTRLAANVSIYDGIRIGQQCVIHSGAVIGADGFGFANDGGRWVKIHQLGGVVIGDRVEIGAGTTIDRGALDDTSIGDGVILDNQVQIAHNVIIGENTAIAGCTAVAGSTRIGKQCTIAGACGITGHLSIADGTHVTAMSLISKSITEPGAYSSGTTMEPHRQWKRNAVRFRQLDELARRVKELETIIKQNTEGQSE